MGLYSVLITLYKFYIMEEALWDNTEDELCKSTFPNGIFR